MHIVCFDMEGVFTPEIWVNVAKKTGVDELKITTRDEPDYNKLMRYRLSILEQHGISLRQIQEVISSLDLLPGARDFFDRVRTRSQAIIVTDSFVEFAMPFIDKLGKPMVFCHNLIINGQGMITGYQLRQPDPKRCVVQAFQSLRYRVVGIGDSYNDITMLQQAEKGILFRPPASVMEEYPGFPVTLSYEELQQQIDVAIALL